MKHFMRRDNRDFVRKQNFLKKKLELPISAETSDLPVTFPCDQCDYTNTKKRGLDTHVRQKHKIVQQTPEVFRNQSVIESQSPTLSLPSVSRAASRFLDSTHSDEDVSDDSTEISKEPSKSVSGPCLFCGEIFHTEEGITNHLLTTCLENLKSQLFAMGVAVESLDEAKLKILLHKVLEVAKSDKNTT